MSGVLALVPYYGGTGDYAPSPVSKRQEYLNRTVKSLESFADLIVVGVARQIDMHAASNSGDVLAIQFPLGEWPELLPYELAWTAQREEGLAPSFDYVYVTEADQVLHADDDLLHRVGGKEYLVPHRLEQLGPNRAGADRGPLFHYDDTEYITGERPAPPVSEARFYSPINLVDAYGGAYLMDSTFFQGIHFNKPDTFPVESITGFVPAHLGLPFKTTEWSSFFVEHLSGYDYHCKLAEGTA